MRIAVLAFLSVLLCGVTPQTASAAAAQADRDGDKIFDDLAAGLNANAPHAVLVALHEPASAARVREIEDEVGDLGPITRLRLVDAFAARATPTQIEALAARADVAHVEENATAVPFGVSAQASFGVTRAREDIPGLDGSGMVAAVIDTGIDTSMPDLPPGKVVGFKDLVGTGTAPYDDNGHGSLVSDILAGSGASGAEGRGVAPAAKLVVVKVADKVGNSSLAKIAEAIQWVVEHRAQYGIDVINLSLGDPNGCGAGSDVASQAVNAAVAQGLTVIAASGNSGPEPCTVKSPAAAESALTVGAMADLGAGGFSLAWFSSRGPTLDGRIKPDVVAPGVDVMMAAPWTTDHVAQSGTSAAAPFVTGSALLLLQANEGLTPAQVKAAMTDTAIDWGAPGRDNLYGAGRLDVYAALRAVGAPLAVPAAVPDVLNWSGALAQGESVSREVVVADPRFPVAVTMNGPTAGFDLALLDESGSPVGVTTVQFFGPSRQEDISLRAPVEGRYTVRVTARQDSGAFTAEISGGLAPADTSAPSLTLDSLAAGELSGGAGTAPGDFPGVVVVVRQGGEVVRRLAAKPVSGRWSVRIAPPLPDGDYTVEAEQGDAAGHVAHVPARASTVDTVAPLAPVIGGADVTQRVSRVQLQGTAELGAAIEVSEGGPTVPGGETTADGNGTWSVVLQGVPDGRHAYVATAADKVGNTSAASGARVIVIDTVAPIARFLGAPSGLIATRSPAVTFSANEAATFECRVDGAWAPCSSPLTLGPLVDGRHSVLVRATDAAGNVGGEVVSPEFTVDTTAPETTISALGETSAEPGATLECRANGGAWGACANAYGLAGPGTLVLEARATDAAGNVGPIARREWTIDPPATVFTAPPEILFFPPQSPAQVLAVGVPAQKLRTVLARGLSVTVGCARSCAATLVLAQGKKVLVRRTVPAGKATLRLSAATRRALARSKRVTFTLTVTASGASTVTRTVTLKR